MTTVSILHVAGCANLELARSRVRAAIDRLDADTRVEERVVVDAEAASRFGMAGSPTILVDGRDVVDPGDTAMSVSCRLYRTPEGLEGAPPVDAIVSAVASAIPRG